MPRKRKSSFLRDAGAVVLTALGVRYIASKAPVWRRSYEVRMGLYTPGEQVDPIQERIDSLEQAKESLADSDGDSGVKTALEQGIDREIGRLQYLQEKWGGGPFG